MTNPTIARDESRSRVPLTLYELSEEQLALDALVHMDEGEWTEETEELFSRLVAQLATKADDFGRYVRTRESVTAAIAEEEKRLAARRKAIEAHVKRLKEYAVFALQRMDRPKIEGDTFTLAIQKNNPSLVVDVEPEELPEDYVRIVPASLVADKAAILRALKAGEEIAGCSLSEGFHLRIR